MQTMQGYTAIASYTQHHRRIYHQADTSHSGPSVSLAEWYQGKRPAPLVTTTAPRPARAQPRFETYAPPRTLDLVTMVKQGQALPPLTPARPTTNALACGTCHRLPCRCGVGKAGGLDAIVAMQRARGTRP